MDDNGAGLACKDNGDAELGLRLFVDSKLDLQGSGAKSSVQTMLSPAFVCILARQPLSRGVAFSTVALYSQKI